jgi:Permeases of the drug/metabolite transporter (DMT) superfamily
VGKWRYSKFGLIPQVFHFAVFFPRCMFTNGTQEKLSRFALNLYRSNMLNSKRLTLYAAVILAQVFWALTFIWYKQFYQVYGAYPITLVFFRLLISLLMLIPVSYFLGKLEKIKAGDLKLFFILAFFEPLMYFIGESIGVTMISSSVASVIISTIPLFTPISAYLFHKEYLTRASFAGIVISILGVLLVLVNKDFQLVARPLGVLLMFLAVASTMGYSAVIKTLTSRYNVFTITTYQNTIGALFFLPLFVFFEGDHFMIAPISGRAIMLVLLMSVFASTLAFLLFSYSIRGLGINKATVFNNAIPVITTILAIIILHERLTLLQFVGMSIVIGGLLLSQLNQGHMKTMKGIMKNGYNLARTGKSSGESH